MRIRLTNGYVTEVDRSNYKSLAQFKWRGLETKNKNGEIILVYACRNTWDGKRKGSILMHRQIMNESRRAVRIDHRDHDGLNNRRSNLRRSSSSQNQINGPKTCANTSGFRGVTWDKQLRKWRAQIMHKGKGFFLGSFVNAKEAANAYKLAVKEKFGEFAPI